MNTPVKEKNNYINIYNKFQSPIRNNLKEYYPEYKDNGYSSKPSKKVNIIQRKFNIIHINLRINFKIFF